MSKFIEYALIFLSGVVVPIGIFLADLYIKRSKRRRKDIVMEHLEVQLKNQEVLDDIRNEINASRVCLWKFSNGTDFLDNTHMLHISLICESNANEYESMKQDFNRVPASLFERGLNVLKAKPWFFTDESKIGDQLSHLNASYGLYKIFGAKLWDKNGKWIGILTVGLGDLEETMTDDQIAWTLLKSKRIQ